jgi:hypothetical protein
MSSQPLFKNVRVNLSSFTRVEYSEVIQVPVDITEEELKDLANRRYTEVDGSDFSDDPDYWETGTVECVSAPSEEDASLRLVGGALIEINPEV